MLTTDKIFICLFKSFNLFPQIVIYWSIDASPIIKSYGIYDNHYVYKFYSTSTYYPYSFNLLLLTPKLLLFPLSFYIRLILAYFEKGLHASKIPCI